MGRWQGKNCHRGRGALVDLDTDDSAPSRGWDGSPLTRAQCLQRCVHDRRCDAVVYQRWDSPYAMGTCWKKTLQNPDQITDVPAACAPSRSKDTYFRIACPPWAHH